MYMVACQHGEKHKEPRSLGPRATLHQPGWGAKMVRASGGAFAAPSPGGALLQSRMRARGERHCEWQNLL